MTPAVHIPVLVKEVMATFSPQSGDNLLDATLGHGGHAAAYLAATSPNGTVVGLDADPQAVVVAQQNLKKFGNRVRFVESNFAHLKDLNPSMFSHILFDLGMGSHQLGDSARGFSFIGAGPLTMAYGPLENLPSAKISALNALEKHLGRLPDATDILPELAESDLGELLRFYGEERYAQRIARAIKRQLPIATARQLAEVVAQAVPAGYEHGRINPATRTFQALRLAVNRELETLEAALPQAIALLRGSGILVVISFHSLEDRLVKQFFRSRKSELEILTKKPVRASGAEVKENPRSRSAKLRAVIKS